MDCYVSSCKVQHEYKSKKQHEYKRNIEELAEEGGEFMVEVVRCLGEKERVDPLQRGVDFWHVKEMTRGEGSLEDLVS